MAAASFFASTTRLLLGSLLAACAASCATSPPDAGSTGRGVSGVDPQLAQAIAAIKAIDNHAHPVRPTGAGESPDQEFDALPVDNLEPQSDPVRQRPTSPEVIAASRDPYVYEFLRASGVSAIGKLAANAPGGGHV